MNGRFWEIGRLLPITVVVIVLVPSTITAQGLRLNSFLEQKFSLQNNDGWDGTSTSSVGATLETRTRASRFGVSSGVSLTYETDTNEFEISSPQLSFSYETQRRNLTVTSGLSYASQPLSFNEEQPDLSVVTLTGDRETIGAQLGVSTNLSTQVQGSLTGYFTQVDFDPVTATTIPWIDYGVDGTLTYQRDALNRFGLQAGISMISFDTTENSESLSLDLMGTYSHTLDARSGLDANLGIAFVKQDETVLGVTRSAYTTSLLYGLGYRTELSRSDGLDISLRQTLDPSASGDLSSNTGLQARYTRAVNRNSNYQAVLSLNHQRDIDGGSGTTYMLFSNSYARQILPDVSLNTTVSVAREDDGDINPGISLSLRRTFDFLVR